MRYDTESANWSVLIILQCVINEYNWIPISKHNGAKTCKILDDERRRVTMITLNSIILLLPHISTSWRDRVRWRDGPLSVQGQEFIIWDHDLLRLHVPQLPLLLPVGQDSWWRQPRLCGERWWQSYQWSQQGHTWVGPNHQQCSLWPQLSHHPPQSSPRRQLCAGNAQNTENSGWQVCSQTH